MPSTVLTPKSIAEITGKHEDTVRKQMSDNERTDYIKGSYKAGSSWLVSVRDFERWQKRQAVSK